MMVNNYMELKKWIKEKESKLKCRLSKEIPKFSRKAKITVTYRNELNFSQHVV